MTKRKGGIGRRPGRRRECKQKKVTATSARRSKGGNAEGKVATVAVAAANAAARRARLTDAGVKNEGGKESSARRDVRPVEKSGDTTTTADDGDGHFIYRRIDDAQARRYSYPSHVLETLTGERGSGLIERYHVYERRPCDEHPPGPATAASDAPAGRTRNRERRRQEAEVEVVVGDVKFGDILDGHPGVVHGGVTSLVFDDLMGHACDVLLRVGGGRESAMTMTTGTSAAAAATTTTCVTANLSVNFRSPMPSGSEAVVRVYHELGKSKGRKIHLRATMSSYDGGVLFSDATSLYVKVEAAVVNEVDSEAMIATSASEETSVSMNKDDAGTTTTGTSMSGDVTTGTSSSGDIFI